MTCDEGRPCQRCIKREIGHLCHDERRSKPMDKEAASETVDTSRAFAPVPVYRPPQVPLPPPPLQNTAWPMNVPQNPFVYQQETTLGNEFSVLSHFLETLDQNTFFTEPQNSAPLMSSAPFPAATSPNVEPVSALSESSGPLTSAPSAPAPTTMLAQDQNGNTVGPGQPLATSSMSGDPSAEASGPTTALATTKTEKFLMTAADQESGTRDERLNRVIRTKYEAGLLKPHSYVKGYARLSRWMDRNVSQESKQKILQPLSVLRPKFRAVAQSLRDIDLVFIEEAFERLLLDYDRVFSTMSVPACLWRRTGEIYKGNREFTELIGIDGYMMRDGRLCIYELMAEESAVNYWQKYSVVAFDSSQKAVLTSCVLRYKPVFNLKGRKQVQGVQEGETEELLPLREEGFINCCFSFTIRRDKWGIPTMIVGNFIKC